MVNIKSSIPTVRLKNIQIKSFSILIFILLLNWKDGRWFRKRVESMLYKYIKNKKFNVSKWFPKNNQQNNIG